MLLRGPRPLLFGSSSRLAAVLLLIGVTSMGPGCATELEDGEQSGLEARCLEASDALASCQGGSVELASEMAALCETEPAEAEELIDSMTGEACSAGEADDPGRSGFAGACSMVYTGSQVVTQLRNGGARRLSDHDQTFLRRFVGDSAERARIRRDARLMTEWEIQGRKISLSEGPFIEPAGMTLGSTMYIAEGTRNDLLELVSHEIVHVAQRDRYGSTLLFSYAYCEALYDAGFQYASNRFEIEANGLEERIARCWRAYNRGEIGEDCPGPPPLR